MVKRFAVTRELIDHPKTELEKLLAQHEQQEKGLMRQLVHDFAQRFQENHKLVMRFTDEAADRLVAIATEKNVQVRDLCHEKFKDFQFGLRLISQNTGQQEFILDEKAVEEPDKTLSDWVVASYKNTSQNKQ
jgi:hypothetical protein